MFISISSFSLPFFIFIPFSQRLSPQPEAVAARLAVGGNVGIQRDLSEVVGTGGCPGDFHGGGKSLVGRKSDENQ